MKMLCVCFILIGWGSFILLCVWEVFWKISRAASARSSLIKATKFSGVFFVKMLW